MISLSETLEDLNRRRPVPQDTPEYLQPHQGDYKEAAWKKWDLWKLGNIVAFFAERATHRSDPVKRAKDIQDARNYHAMMGEAIDAMEKSQ